MLKIEPAELSFPPPYNILNQQTLYLTNTTASDVAFKVKTTSPKRYCVRPNGGIIEPNKTIEVNVLLQPTDDPEINKDKFLLETVALEPSHHYTAKNIGDFWQSVRPDQIQKQKFRCNFGSTIGEETTSTSTLSKPTSDPVFDTKPRRIDPSVFGNAVQNPSTITAFTQPSTISSTIAPSSTGTSTEIDSLKQKYTKVSERLSSVTAERDRLQREIDQLKESGLRQRKAGTETGTTGAGGKLGALSSSLVTTKDGFTIIHLVLVALAAFTLGVLLW